MTQEDKQLLLKELCARLPYNVVVRCTDSDTDYKCFLTTDILHEIQNGYEYYDYKPYLRPLSSITEEEKEDYKHIVGPIIYDEYSNLIIGFECNTFEQFVLFENWLNTHHFDYRGLIEKGLALEAYEGMYEI